MNAGTGALGPYNHANATIGRAYGLLSQNGQGGSVPGLSYMGNQGNNYAYNSVTFAENEERSPWEPFHVQHGFRPGDSAVSVFSGLRSTAFTLGCARGTGASTSATCSAGMDPHVPPTLLLDPIAARQFVDRGGFTTKDALIDWLHDTRAHARRRSTGTISSSRTTSIRARRSARSRGRRSSRRPPTTPIPMFRREDIHVVVVGGETNGYWRIMGCDVPEDRVRRRLAVTTRTIA